MTIETDTPIIPLMVAETVVGAWQTWLDTAYPFVSAEVEPKADEIAEYLAARAERSYQGYKFTRTLFRRGGDKGRDTVHTFMRHWMHSQMLKSFPVIDSRLIPKHLT